MSTQRRSSSRLDANAHPRGLRVGEHVLRDRYFLQRIRVTETGCWEWLGNINKKSGYAHVSVYGGRKNPLAHRALWHLLFGDPVPPHLHHTCENKPCVNPRHLVGMEPGHHQRVHKETRTHCVHGHEFTAANTYIRKDTRTRMCRACLAAVTRSRKERWSEERLERAKKRSAERRRERTGARKLPGSKY